MTVEMPSNPVLARRRAGVLLHPTALPGVSGKLGAAARQFVDVLAEAGITVWQTLPLGPTHADLSPYQSLSAHAGNPVLIDLAELVAPGLLDSQELTAFTRTEALEHASQRFHTGRYRESETLNAQAYQNFLEHHQWLDDFALFMTAREAFPGVNWLDWPEDLRDHKPTALKALRESHQSTLERVCLEQYLFFVQWTALRHYAAERGIWLFGDIPIFVAHDSADVWAAPHLYKLDGEGKPRVIAGVPPDYFSPEGQHWGNPLFDWQRMAEDRYHWWVQRLASQQERFDLLRIDHFRGLQAYWEIPAENPRPVDGYWVPGPADDFLETCFRELPRLPLVAENLGIIGEDVEALRHRFRLPGMTVIQFGFDGSAANPHLLHNHKEWDLVYTGTHDNDTTLGWYQSLDERTREHVNRYLRINGPDMPWPVIQAAMGSVSRLVIVPIQDLLALGSEARFNTPGTIQGNWKWTLPEDYRARIDLPGLRNIVNLYGR
ncbi:4-alpha-glucanotransferase [Marinobacter nauticus]|uniref:4-alpha-glucanotransferase n=1 Tax=Marinobacter nauticus TaxID=2743 RepID=UPI001C998D88|nr:4-alpha-glucanotransferase [Marinobacter nauticus]MBY5935960.1 4-alpha-glucanotransferase [Marinobacter nauticus]MBY5953189.1 4-alpha-glucanotransferase [Marinobacter nauticus]MBY6006982.1 4-alpha-glucanotransferase [Marinobacter nauticus]